MNAETTTRAFDSIKDEEFISLTTFRRNGVGVPTPVWFAVRDGRIYVQTLEGAGKIKRVQATGKVEVAPSDARGNIHGVTFVGTGRVLERAEAAHAESVIQAKYGERRTAFLQQMSASGQQRAYLEVVPS